MFEISFVRLENRVVYRKGGATDGHRSVSLMWKQGTNSLCGIGDFATNLIRIARKFRNNDLHSLERASISRLIESIMASPEGPERWNICSSRFSNSIIDSVKYGGWNRNSAIVP